MPSPSEEDEIVECFAAACRQISHSCTAIIAVLDAAAPAQPRQEAPSHAKVNALPSLLDDVTALVQLLEQIMNIACGCSTAPRLSTDRSEAILVSIDFFSAMAKVLTINPKSLEAKLGATSTGDRGPGPKQHRPSSMEPLSRSRPALQLKRIQVKTVELLHTAVGAHTDTSRSQQHRAVLDANIPELLLRHMCIPDLSPAHELIVECLFHLAVQYDDDFPTQSIMTQSILSADAVVALLGIVEKRHVAGVLTEYSPNTQALALGLIKHALRGAHGEALLRRSPALHAPLFACALRRLSQATTLFEFHSPLQIVALLALYTSNLPEQEPILLKALPGIVDKVLSLCTNTDPASNSSPDHHTSLSVEWPLRALDALLLYPHTWPLIPPRATAAVVDLNLPFEQKVRIVRLFTQALLLHGRVDDAFSIFETDRGGELLSSATACVRRDPTATTAGESAVWIAQLICVTSLHPFRRRYHGRLATRQSTEPLPRPSPVIEAFHRSIVGLCSDLVSALHNLLLSKRDATTILFVDEEQTILNPVHDEDVPNDLTELSTSDGTRISALKSAVIIRLAVRADGGQTDGGKERIHPPERGSASGDLTGAEGVRTTTHQQGRHCKWTAAVATACILLFYDLL